MMHTERLGAVCLAVLSWVLVGCSPSEREALSCGDLLDAAPRERGALVASAWQRDGGSPADRPRVGEVEGLCRDLPTLHLGPALRAVANAARSATSTTVPDAPGDDVLNVRGVRQIIPIVAAGSGGPSGALANIAAVCVAESVGPHAVASAFDEPVVVADDDVCYRLGPVLFETTSIGSVIAEGDEDVAARRLKLQLTGDDVGRFAELTEAAAAAAPAAPTGQLAFLLNGALLDVANIHDTVNDGTITLHPAGSAFLPATVAIFESMAGAR